MIDNPDKCQMFFFNHCIYAYIEFESFIEPLALPPHRDRLITLLVSKIASKYFLKDHGSDNKNSQNRIEIELGVGRWWWDGEGGRAGCLNSDNKNLQNRIEIGDRAGGGEGVGGGGGGGGLSKF